MGWAVEFGHYVERLSVLVPRSAIKALAGFDVNFQANYYLPRAKEEPSEELARQV
jgi:hypothetical protein